MKNIFQTTNKIVNGGIFQIKDMINIQVGISMGVSSQEKEWHGFLTNCSWVDLLKLILTSLSGACALHHTW
jgi:hypothetical protein